MNLFQVCFLLLFLTVSLEGNRFRCDYKYVKESNAYFKYHEIPVNWHEARLRCSLEGAVLASPLDQALKEAMESVVEMVATSGTRRLNHKTERDDINSCPTGLWTGMHSLFSKGDYVSIEGVPLNEINVTWTNCEPNNDQNQEACIAMQKSGEIADVNCNKTLPYICYKRVVPGMNINACGSPDNEYTNDKRTGKCYKFHRIPRTWSVAAMTCMAEGGHLAIINNDVEDQLLKELFFKGPMINSAADYYDRAFIHIGLKDWDQQGDWRTIHGQTLQEAGFEKWNIGAPSSPTIKFCGGMVRSGLLDSTSCDRRATFICEKDPDSLTCGHERKAKV